MKHILFTLKGCTRDLLNDEEFVRDVVYTASRKCKSTLLALNSHKFDPQGVTCIAMLAESHISIHTWPEKGMAVCDIFTCCLLYTSPSPRDRQKSRMPSSA